MLRSILLQSAVRNNVSLVKIQAALYSNLSPVSVRDQRLRKALKSGAIKLNIRCGKLTE